MQSSSYLPLELKPSSNICRCCLAEGCFKDISCEYYYLGHKEVYENMLRDTFNIEISNQDDKNCQKYNRFICCDCIKLLRDSYNFKCQVIQSEATFLKSMKFINVDKYNETVVNKDKDIKEVTQSDKIWSDSSINYSCDMNFDSFDDDEILANIKIELNKEHVIKKTARKIRKEIINKKKKAKSVEAENLKDTKTNYEKVKQPNKITERRGNGPILRENSLKLIENSTMCVFQWNKSRYRCFCCDEPFSEMAALREHTTSHTLKNIEKKIISQQNRLVKVEVTSLHCKLCRNSVENIQDLQRHLFAAHEVNFDSDDSLLVPFKLGTDILSCQLCLETFTMFRLLNIHMNRHYQKQVCHICGAGFSNLVFLNLHKTRSHRVLKCNSCNVEFSTRSEKKEHDISVHGAKFERKLRFPCPFCDARFFQENLKIHHLVERHGMKKPEYKCNMCAKVFITRSLANNHMKNVHMKEKRRECDICHMRFYTKSDVARHRVTHTGEKNFSCLKCHNTFATKDSLRRHNKRSHVNTN